MYWNLYQFKRGTDLISRIEFRSMVHTSPYTKTCVLTTIELNCEKIFVFVGFIVTCHLLNILVKYFFFWILWKYFERVFNMGRTRFAVLKFKAQRKYFNFSYLIEQQQYRWFIQWESKHIRGWWRRRRWWRSLPSTRKVTKI